MHTPHMHVCAHTQMHIHIPIHTTTGTHIAHICIPMHTHTHVNTDMTQICIYTHYRYTCIHTSKYTNIHTKKIPEPYQMEDLNNSKTHYLHTKEAHHT